MDLAQHPRGALGAPGVVYECLNDAHPVIDAFLYRKQCGQSCPVRRQPASEGQRFSWHISHCSDRISSSLRSAGVFICWNFKIASKVMSWRPSLMAWARFSGGEMGTSCQVVAFCLQISELFLFLLYATYRCLAVLRGKERERQHCDQAMIVSHN